MKRFLLEAHPLVGVLDVGDLVEQVRAHHLRLALEVAEPLGAAARALHLEREVEHALAHLGEHRERELRRLHLARDPRVDLCQLLRVARVARLVALLEQRAQALDRALDARGDLAGLLVADRLGELRAVCESARSSSQRATTWRAQSGIEYSASRRSEVAASSSLARSTSSSRRSVRVPPISWKYDSRGRRSRPGSRSSAGAARVAPVACWVSSMDLLLCSTFKYSSTRRCGSARWCRIPPGEVPFQAFSSTFPAAPRAARQMRAGAADEPSAGGRNRQGWGRRRSAGR
jgi:hypothetical protein